MLALMASSGIYDSQPPRRNSGSQLIQEVEALTQSLYLSQEPLLPRRIGSLSLSVPNAKKLQTREEHAVLDEAIPLPGLTNARHNSMDPTASRNLRHSIAHPQPVEPRVRGAKGPRISASATSGIISENVDIRCRSHHSLSPFRRRKGEELNRANDDRNFLSVHEEEDDVRLSKKMEHKHSAFWTWKPMRALSHIGMHRFNCIFSVYVNAIHGLSPSINGLRLCVNLRRKESRDGAVQTMPARVFQCVAEFDESLRIHCHVYGSSSRHGGSHGTMKFQSRPFVISAVAVDAEELDFGKHHVDLGILLQEAVQKHPAGEDSDDGWNIRFALSGKARGAELVVGLGYEILDKDERFHIGSCKFKDYAEHQAGRTPSRVFRSPPSSVRGTPKTGATPGFTSAAYHSGSPFQSQRGTDDLADFIRIAHLNLDDPAPTPESRLQSQMLQTVNSTLNEKSEGRRLEEIGLKDVPEQEQENSTSDAMNHPSDLEIENAEDEGFFEVEEQGVELVEIEVEENETETTTEQLDKEGSVHEIVKEVIEEASQRRLVELDFISQQIEALESEIFDKTAGQQSAMEPPGNQDSKDYKFENDSVKGYQNTDEVLMDDDVSAVEGEFLHLLETEEFGLDSEENMQKSTLKDGTADSEEDMDQLTSILAELGETELKQMSHVSDSKTRAKTLEVEETEDLMQKWGLNKNVFKNSSRNSDPIGNFSDKAMKKQMKRPPDLGDGLGSRVMQVQTRDGGMLVSMNPAHFRSGARLVMHVSKPVVLPAEMGDTAVEILQNMAGMGITHMTSRAMDSMPLDDIAGKTVEQISFEGMASAITKSGYFEQNANLKTQPGKGTLLSKGFGASLSGNQKSKAVGLQVTGTMLDESVSLDNIVPLAMQRIEAMALEGLRIQAEMAEVEASYSILAKRSKINRPDGIFGSNSSDPTRLMAVVISLDEWMALDSGLYDEATTNENTRAILAAHHGVLKQQKKKEGEGYMGNSVTISLLVQLRDPLRNYEGVGFPMIALVEAEKVAVLLGSTKELITHENWDSPRFKIKGVHMSGLKLDETKKIQRVIWGNQKHQYQKSTASRWLMANNMAKNSRHINSLVKSNAQQHPANMKAGEYVWSISARLNSSSAGAAMVLNSYFRNPDIVIPNQTFLRRA